MHKHGFHFVFLWSPYWFQLVPSQTFTVQPPISSCLQLEDQDLCANIDSTLSFISILIPTCSLSKVYCSTTNSSCLHPEYHDLLASDLTDSIKPCGSSCQFFARFHNWISCWLFLMSLWFIHCSPCLKNCRHPDYEATTLKKWKAILIKLFLSTNMDW